MTFNLALCIEFPATIFMIYKPEAKLEVLISTIFLPIVAGFVSENKMFPLISETIMLACSLFKRVKLMLVTF